MDPTQANPHFADQQLGLPRPQLMSANEHQTSKTRVPELTKEELLQNLAPLRKKWNYQNFVVNYGEFRENMERLQSFCEQSGQTAPFSLRGNKRLINELQKDPKSFLAAIKSFIKRCPVGQLEGLDGTELQDILESFQNPVDRKEFFQRALAIYEDFINETHYFDALMYDAYQYVQEWEKVEIARPLVLDKGLGRSGALSTDYMEETGQQINLYNQHWKGDYIGELPEILLERLLYYSKEELYARFVPILNSSGVGKSKCVDELGSKGPLVIGVVLRMNGDSGYPPGDPELVNFFKEARQCTSAWECNAVSLAFLLGIFQAFLEWAKRRKLVEEYSGAIVGWRMKANIPFSQVAIQWRQDMTPVRWEESQPSESHDSRKRQHPDSPSSKGRKPPFSVIIARSRSKEKRRFTYDLVTYARAALETFHDEKEWVMQGVQQEEAPKASIQNKVLIKEIIEIFLPPGHPEGEFFVLSIDEAGLLFEKDIQPDKDAVPNPNGIIYYSIRRMLRVLRDLPLWCITVSTKSNIIDMMPSVDLDPSARVLMFDLVRADPFTTLPMDVVMADAIRRDEPAEVSKSLADFQMLDHVKTMGRILWDVISSKKWTEKHANKFVLTKLLSQTPSDFLDRFPTKRTSGATTEQRNQCFALIASRINIDDCSTTTEAAELIKQSIFSHLRLLHTLDAQSGYVLSVTPSEPIVAQASSELLSMNPSMWPMIIEIVTKELFQPGLVDKGKKGEFYVLQLLILARDQLFSKLHPRSPASSLSGTGTFPGTAGIKLRHCAYFSLERFLRALLKPDAFNKIWNEKKEGSSSGRTMGEVFSNAKLNFTHFTTATTHLYGDKDVKHTEHGRQVQMQRELLEKLEILHLMLYRHAGMAMAVNQPDWDACLSTYFGDADKPIQHNEISCIFIQTKNVKDGFSPPREPAPEGSGKSKTDMPFASNFSHFPITTTPILGLIFNIGYKGKNPGVRQLHHAQDNVWYYDIRGSGSEIYECLKEAALEQACQRLLGVLINDRNATPAQRKVKDTFHALSRFTFSGQAGKEEAVRR